MANHKSEHKDTPEDKGTPEDSDKPKHKRRRKSEHKRKSGHTDVSEHKDTPERTDASEHKDTLEHTDASEHKDTPEHTDAPEQKDRSKHKHRAERRDKSEHRQVAAPLEPIQLPERSQRGIRTAQVRAFAGGSEADAQRRCPTRERTVKELAKERERESKWIQLLPSEGGPGHAGSFQKWRKSHSSVFRDLILEGIPDAVRSRAWRVVLDSDAKGHPKEVTARQLAERAVPECDAAIRADIARVIPLMAPFATTDIGQRLYAVLRAYANSDSELGYREGMGYVAALLVSYMSEDHAFWAFGKVMRGKALHLRDYHLGDALQKALSVWLYLLKSQFKKFHKHCKKIGVEHINYLRGWFIHFFLSVDFLPVLRLRIWDRIAGFGAQAVFSLGLTFVALLEKDLLKRGRDELTLTLQNPILGVQEGDWRNVIKKWNKLWIGAGDYKEILAKVSIHDLI
jgi:hypothetical protein